MKKTIGELLANIDYTAKDINECNSVETLILLWKEQGLAVVDECETYKATHEPMEIKQFLNHCTACGGDWGAMLLTGIREIAPAVWNAIPDDMGLYAFCGICETLNCMGIECG